MATTEIGPGLGTWGNNPGLGAWGINSLHTLDPCLALLVAYLMGKGNMSKPALAVHQGGMQEGIHRVSFNIVSFTEWEVLKAECKLGVEVLCNLELGSMGNAFNCLVMDHTILEDPQVGDIAMRWETTLVAQEVAVNQEEMVNRG